MFSNKKGIIGGAIVVLMLAGVIILGIIGFYMTSIFAPPFLSLTDQATDTILDNAPQEKNFSLYVNYTLGSANRTLQGNSQWFFSYGLLFLIFLIFIVLAFFVRGHPILIVVWIFLMLVVEFAAIYLSIVWERLKADSYLSGVYETWTINSFVNSSLPYIVPAIMILGGIVLFMIYKYNDIERAGGGYY